MVKKSIKRKKTFKKKNLLFAVSFVIIMLLVFSVYMSFKAKEDVLLSPPEECNELDSCPEGFYGYLLHEDEESTICFCCPDGTLVGSDEEGNPICVDEGIIEG